jgi:SAM-dependent MidA family methyltransferase
MLFLYNGLRPLLNRQGFPLQAIKQHKFVDLLHAPGSADLSAWVDFAAFKRAAAESGGETARELPKVCLRMPLLE